MMLDLSNRHYAVVLFEGKTYQAFQIQQQMSKGTLGKQLQNLPQQVRKQFRADYIDQYRMNIDENKYLKSIFNFKWFELLIPERSVILYVPIKTIIDGKQIQYLNLQNHEEVAKAFYRAAK